MLNIFKQSLAISLIVIVLLSGLGIGYVALSRHYEGALAAEKTALRAKIENEQFATKRREIEQVFKLMYESIRLIALFPAVRAISGGNRQSGEGDVVKAGRFSLDAHEIVQQLYNNLASNVGAIKSEG